jgi:acyl carrier protein
MTQPDIFAAIRDTLAAVKSETGPVSPDEITPELELEEAPLSLDSLEFLQLIAWIEERLGVVAQDDSFVELRTVQNLVDAARQWLANRSVVT